jgi:TonB family protein
LPIQIVFMLFALVLSTPAWTADGVQAAASPGVSGQLRDFDIPAQALDAALDRYAAVSRRPALFRSELVSGRTSFAVRGRFSSEIALDLLLQGTGLMAEKSTDGPADAFVLVESDANALPAAASYDGIDGLVSDRKYPGLVQAGIWQALCGNALTVPGTYRSLLRFQLDAMGRIERVRLLGTTGNARRDAAVVQTLQAVHVDPPPPDMAQQPLTMLILPDGQGAARRCDRE